MDDRPPEAQDAWNRFGQYMEAWAGYGTRVLGRNQALWAAIAKDLDGGPYTSDKAANDAVLAMSVMQRNAEDLWRVLTGSLDTQRFVQVLPTAFLFFDLPDGAKEHTLVDPVHIPLPAEVDPESCPEHALIALSGTASRRPKGGDDLKPSVDDLSTAGVVALQGRLTARRSAGSAYVLETVVTPTSPSLVPGVYDGLVYLTKPQLPLANLRVIVEGPPPEV